MISLTLIFPHIAASSTVIDMTLQIRSRIKYLTPIDNIFSDYFMPKFPWQCDISTGDRIK